MEMHIYYNRRSYEDAIETVPTGLLVWVEAGVIVEWFNGERRTGPLPVDYEFSWYSE
jgi:hypothetical protein